MVWLHCHVIHLTLFWIVLVGEYRGCLAFSLSMKASSKMSVSTTASFWNGPLSSLADPPSPKRLKLIQAFPYRGGFEPACDKIEPYSSKIVQGSIPSDLVGSLATNGPGRIRIGETQYGHWFDGDGYVTLLSFKDGKATFRARYVRTERFKAQEALLRKHREDTSPPLAFSGAWTLAGRGKWYENILRVPTNPSNTATIWMSNGPRLYCLCEGGHPVELDPCTLETLHGETPFSGANNIKVESFFSAHFSRDVETGDVYNHGYILNPGSARLNVMRLSSDGTLLQQRQCALPFDTFVHDSTLSQHYLVYFLPPFHNPPSALWKFVLGLSPIGKLYKWEPESLDSYVHVHSKTNLELQWKIKLFKTVTLYHLVDAHDELNPDGTVTLKVRVAEHVPPDRVTLEKQFGDQYFVEDGTRLYTVLREYTFHLGANGEVLSVADKDVCDEAALCEFPSVNNMWKPGERRQFCWTNALSSPKENYLDGIQKIDMKHATASPVATFGDYSYAGPPAFMPKEGATEEDDGYIIATVYRSLEHRSDIVILDAATLKLLCTMELTHHVPYQFHGDFLAGFVPN